jgi:recombination protein RecT
MALAVEANKLPRDIDIKSVAVAGFNAAITGAILGPGYGHAFLVPFWNTKREIRECQLIWGYKGLVDLAYETGFLAALHTELVLEGEKTSRWVDEEGQHIRHELPAMIVARDLGWERVRAAYCIWRATTGQGGVQIVEREELAKLKRRGNVWDSHPLPMCRKTAVIRAAKHWKLTGRLGMAVSLEDHAEAGKPQPPLEPMPEEAEPSPTTDDFPGATEAGEPGTEAPSKTTTKLLTGMEDARKQERD